MLSEAKILEEEWKFRTDGLFKADAHIFSTRILGRDVEFAATALLEGQVTGVGPCRGQRGFHNSAVSWRGTLKVDGSVRTSVRPMQNQKHSRSRTLFKSCVSAKYLEVCITVSGTVEVELRSGSHFVQVLRGSSDSLVPGRSLDPDYAAFKVSVEAVGSVSAKVAEVGVRAAGTLLDMRTDNQVLMTRDKMSVSTHYQLYPMRFQIGIDWRNYQIKYNRRRRWLGSVTYGMSNWRPIRTLYDEEYSGVTRRSRLLKSEISMADLSEVLYAADDSSLCLH